MDFFLANHPEPSIARYTLFRRVFAATTLLLIAATWRLWAIESDFPCVPLIGMARSAPSWIDWLLRLLIVCLLAGLVVISGRSRWERAFSTAASIALFCSFLLNQHRLQPWAYLAAIGCLAIASGDSRRTFRLWRALCISVYTFSAISKFDDAFLDQIGQRLLTSGASFLRIETSNLPSAVRTLAVTTMPLCELFIGIGLNFSRTRRVALTVCIVFHSALILILGPLGLHHQPAVLIWNAALMVEVILLFTTVEQPPDNPPARRTFTCALAECVTLWAIVIPVFEPLGWTDHWPSWCLYSEQTDKVELLVRNDQVSRLPWELRQLSVTYQGDPRWTKAYIEDWSLRTLRAPVYPEDRFQVGVALAIARRYRLEEAVIVHVHSPPHRINGTRVQETLVGTQSLEQKAKSFRLNAVPRALDKLPVLRRNRNTIIMTSMSPQHRFRTARFHFALLLCVAGCSRRDTSEQQRHADSAVTPRTAVPLRVLVCDDVPLAEAIEREWQAISGAAIEVQRTTADQLTAVGVQADVIVFAPRHIGDLVARRLLRPLTGAAEPASVDLQDFFPLARQHEMRWGKQLHAISLGSPQLVLFYDQQAFEKQGLAPPATWREYQQVVVTLNSSGSPAPAAEPLGPGWATRMFVARAACYARDPSQYSCLFNIRAMAPQIATPPFIRALDELRAAVAKMPTEVIQQSPDDVMNRFVKGHVAMAIGWPSAGRAGTLESEPEWKPGCAMLPGSTEFYDTVKKAWTARGIDEFHVPVFGIAGQCVGITRTSNNIDRAVDFIIWVTNYEQGAKISGRSSQTTIFRFSQRSQAEVWLERPLAPIARDYFDLAVRNQASTLSLTVPRVPGQNEYMRVLDESIRTAVSSSEPSQSVLAKAVESWDRITDRLGRSEQTAAYSQSLGID